MKNLIPEQVRTIRSDAARGTDFSELAQRYGITWTDVLSIVNYCSYRTPLDPLLDPPSSNLEARVAYLDKQIAALEKRVWNLEAEQEQQSAWEREQNE